MSKKSSALFGFVLLLVGAGSQIARADTQYVLRVDGLACPYCAYGVEKKLKGLDGVVGDSLQIKLNEGIVRFTAKDQTKFTEKELGKLINDAGFTLRGVTVHNIDPG
jgi:mercuric ion binding protein